MIRWLYNQLWHIAPLFIRRYLKKRAKKSTSYLEHWDERFGKKMSKPVRHPIWIHAVSVGETRAAQPLIEALQNYFPDVPLLLTQMTPTGRHTAQTLYPNAQCRYIPYDKPEWVGQFLTDHAPRFGILMETEIWPNLMHMCAEKQVPLFLANARLSEKSQRGYLKIRGLVEPAMRTLSGCFAQTAQRTAQQVTRNGSAYHLCNPHWGTNGNTRQLSKNRGMAVKHIPFLFYNALNFLLIPLLHFLSSFFKLVLAYLY